MAFVDKKTSWGRLGLHLLVWSSFAAAALALLEGIVRGPVAYSRIEPGAVAMFAYWCYGLRGVSETLMSAGALVYAAGKFLETRTTFSVGFSDAKDVRAKGPDDDDVVWIGHKYASHLEAEAAADAIRKRIGGAA